MIFIGDRKNILNKIFKNSKIKRKFDNIKCKIFEKDFPGGSVVKNLFVNAGDMGLSPDLGKSHILRSNSGHAPQLLSQCSKA